MGRFSDDVRGFVIKTELKTDEAVRKIALQSFSEVIVKSPVDKGGFRGNWQCAIGSVPIGTLDTLDLTGQIAIARAKAVTDTAEAGDTIYLAKNLPYANRLEDGYSTQAPAGMVRLTAQRFGIIVNAVAEDLARK